MTPSPGPSVTPVPPGWRNPLRDKRDKRMPRIAGPCGVVIFGVTGDLSRKKLIPAIYDLALSEAAARLGAPLERARVLCIGDGLPTDIRGANAQDLDVLFIANGIHGAEAVGPQGLQPTVVCDLLRQEGLHARWAMRDLVW